MNLYPITLTLGFLFFIIQLYLVFISDVTEPGMIWFICLLLSVIFFSHAIFTKYKQEKQNKLNPPPQFIGAAKKEAKKLLMVSLSLLVSGYLLLVWSGGWLYPLVFPMWVVGLSFLLVGLSRFIRQLK